jgi:hypothetical protein
MRGWGEDPADYEDDPDVFWETVDHAHDLAREERMLGELSDR